MRAAVLWATGAPLVVEDVELAPPRAGEVLVRLVASGVCHSDLHTVQGIHPWPCLRCSATRAPGSSRRSVRTSTASRPAITWR